MGRGNMAQPGLTRVAPLTSCLVLATEEPA